MIGKQKEKFEAAETMKTKLDSEQLEKLVALIQWVVKNPNLSYVTPPHGVIKTVSVAELLKRFGLN